MAISDHRLKQIDENQVHFEYRDDKDNHQIKICQLSASDFIQRFLWHVLPVGFQKIRYYGFWAGPNRHSQLQSAFQLAEALKETLPKSKQFLLEIAARLFVVPEVRCPSCHEGVMEFQGASHFQLKDYFDTS